MAPATDLTPIAWPAPMALVEQAAVVDVTGELIGWCLPDTPDDAPHDVREGITVRRLAVLQGRCPACSAALVWGNRSTRRRAAAGGRAPAGVPHVPHRPTCAGNDLVLTEAIAWWRGAGAR
ncbi:hypothetical protein [Modestobacter sp. VKM Ac-2978]|uniref:hypothetical protein n=1 Tax=Modestobacter sp. VKM Ac-2978 TaxID=3004132 RepID=UPI0022AAF483|nr:hypothetical protein [Modestobacter sp. VKM Ac-2978]MCZ2850012.1 hypothetical protein [Modestobacter sp. VKM Ac-2978]